MGSRTSFLKGGGFRKYNYKTLIRYNKVRFIKQIDNKPVKIPERSNSKRSVYVLLGKSGRMQSITFYTASRKLYKQIDFTRPHHGILPHVHEIDTEAKDMRSGITRPLNVRERTKVERIIDFYNRHAVKVLFNKE